VVDWAGTAAVRRLVAAARSKWGDMFSAPITTTTETNYAERCGHLDGDSEPQLYAVSLKR
jgi:hypothetical protein